MSIAIVDANGRVLLPIGIRYKLDLNDGDELAIDHLGDGTIILKKIDLQELAGDAKDTADVICSDVLEYGLENTGLGH